MAVSDGRISRLRVTVTVVIALILGVVPLPAGWISRARSAAAAGDLLVAQRTAHRRAPVCVAVRNGDRSHQGYDARAARPRVPAGRFLTHKFQLRMRIFPLSHQTLTVFLLLLV